jgi:cell division initiation protein
LRIGAREREGETVQRLTPLDIQKQTFAKSFKGYSADEVRGYLHLVAEEIERLVKDLDRLSRENAAFRDDLREHAERENILKETLLSAQRVSEDVKSNARKEAELIVKDAELLADRMVGQAMERVGDLERSIQELKVERKAARNKLQALLDTMQQMVLLDIEVEANELPITQIYRRNAEAQER